MTVTQSAFRASLLDSRTAAPDGLTGPDGAPAGKRFDVYRNNVAVGLSDALEAAFPVLRKLVGDTFFRAMAGVYLRQHPPETPLMMFYGAAMPAFLRGFAPARTLPYLPDIAALELALRHAYHAADSAPLDAARLGALSTDALMGARLVLAPAVRTIISDYPVYGIYRANTAPDAPKPQMRPEAVLVTRAGFDPVLHPLNIAGAAFVAALAAGDSIGAAMARADDTLDLGAVLGVLLAGGAITDIC